MLKFNSVRNIKMAEYCDTAWDDLKPTGDPRIRRCARCGELVFRIDAMDPEKALAFIDKSTCDGEDLVLFIRRDGTVKARDTKCEASTSLIERLMKLSACFTL